MLINRGDRGVQNSVNEEAQGSREPQHTPIGKAGSGPSEPTSTIGSFHLSLLCPSH